MPYIYLYFQSDTLVPYYILSESPAADVLVHIQGNAYCTWNAIHLNQNDFEMIFHSFNFRTLDAKFICRVIFSCPI